MKKIFLTIAIVLGMTFGAFAQGGIFGFGDTIGGDNDQSYDRTDPIFSLPSSHGSDEDESPLGSGALLLIGLGAAYAMTKRNKE